MATATRSIHMLRLILLGFLGFVLGLTGGWLNPTKPFVSHSSAAEVNTPQVHTPRTETVSEPMPGLAVTPYGADSSVVISDSLGSRHSAKKRRQLNAKLDGMASRKTAMMASKRPAHLRTATDIDDDDDE
jgi:hypothetical protein